MRLPRIKTPDRLTVYHLRARIIGPRHWYGLQDPQVKTIILQFLKKFLGLYFCDLVSFNIMDNHIHLILRFQPYRRLSQRELQRRAQAYYPRPIDRPHTPRQWRRFNRRLFDVSEFMRNLDGAIAQWFNHTFDRRGSLFCDRFQASILETETDILNCMFYLDLNPIRANLTDRPEDWKWGSARLRIEGTDHHLVSLQELMPGRTPEQCRAEYKWRLYWRGAIGAEEGKRQIPDAIIQAELERGIPHGQDLERQQWLSRGVVIGSFDTVQEWLNLLYHRMIYRKRHRPIPLSHAERFALRPQRTRRWDLAAATGPPP